MNFTNKVTNNKVQFKMVKNESRNFGLDCMRSTAIILVVLNHSIGILNPTSSLPIIGNYFGKALALFQPLGMLGVEMFFVLSGFLIGRILIKQVIRDNGIGVNSLFHFWKRRWMRTLPAYWLILTLLFLAYSVWKPEYYYFLQSYSSQRINFFVESWSLPIEEFFYLLFPLFLIPFVNNFQGIKQSRRILSAILLFIIFFTLIRVNTILYYNFQLHEHVQIRMMTFLRLDAIGYGVLIAWCSIFLESWTKYSQTFFVTGLILIIVFSGLNYLGTHPSLLWYSRYFAFKMLTDFFLYTIFPISFSLLIPFLYGFSDMKANFLSFLITHTSKISYSMYLVHLALLKNLVIDPLLNGGQLNAVILFVIYLVLCYLVSSFLYKWVELPVMKFRDNPKFNFLKKGFLYKRG